MIEGIRKKRGQQSFEEKVRNLRRASNSIHTYPGHIFSRVRPHHILLGIAAILLAVLVVSAIKFYKNYTYYATIIDTQLDHRLLQRHGGVYAAPRHVSVEQRISRDELRERLMRAGYQQEGDGTSDDQFSSGSFFFDGDELKLRTNEFARAGGLPESVNIKFDGSKEGRIVKIENADTGQGLESAALPPELLTVDGAS